MISSDLLSQFTSSVHFFCVLICNIITSSFTQRRLSPAPPVRWSCCFAVFSCSGTSAELCCGYEGQTPAANRQQRSFTKTDPSRTASSFGSHLAIGHFVLKQDIQAKPFCFHALVSFEILGYFVSITLF